MNCANDLGAKFFATADKRRKKRPRILGKFVDQA